MIPVIAGLRTSCIAQHPARCPAQAQRPLWQVLCAMWMWQCGAKHSNGRPAGFHVMKVHGHRLQRPGRGSVGFGGAVLPERQGEAMDPSSCCGCFPQTCPQAHPAHQVCHEMECNANDGWERQPCPPWYTVSFFFLDGLTPLSIFYGQPFTRRPFFPGLIYALG